MKTGSNNWLLRRYEDRKEDGRADALDRLSMKSAAEVALMTILERTEDEEIRSCASNAMYAVLNLHEQAEAVIARHEARGKWDGFRLLHRQLAGQAVELSSLIERNPDLPCNAFKAKQLNRILRPMKELMEDDMGVPLCLVAEDGSNSYSDVSMILRTYQDVSAVYVHRHYDGNPPKMPEIPDDWSSSLVRDQILIYCMDQPRSIMEIGALLGYKDKKTIRKYLNPLLEEGLIVRTVPDKPCSRNQRYITARNV